ncbi:MAG TPA: hypothetical protein ACHBX0_09230 [Arsenophonus sp.]
MAKAGPCATKYHTSSSQTREKQRAEADVMKTFGGAYAANDRDAMKQLFVDYPRQFETIQKGAGFIDQEINLMIGEAALHLQLAAKSGD